MIRTVIQSIWHPHRLWLSREWSTALRCLIGCGLLGVLWPMPGALAQRQPDASIGAVFVTGLPTTHEIAGVCANGGYHFSVASNGDITKFTDSAGNVSIDSIWNINGNQPALAVADDHGTALAPSGAPPKIETISASEVHVTVTYTNGVSVVYVAKPDRLGFQVIGSAVSYKLIFHASARLDGGWVMAGTTAHFLSADLGAFSGARQVLVDMRRSLALEIDAPAASVNWDIARLDSWGGDEYISVSTSLKQDQTVWVAPVAIPGYSGPVMFGLYGQYAYRGTGALQSVATVSSRSLNAAVKLHLSVDPGKAANGDTVYAALLATSPTDPIERDTIGWQWLRKADYTHNFIPVSLTGAGQDWQIAARPGLAPGVYRLRVWIASPDARRPEALGGVTHAVAPLFPDFDTTDANYSQASPQGDTFLVVSPATVGSIALRCPQERTSFWRGEAVPILVQARRSDNGAALVHFEVLAETGGATVAADGLRVATPAGFGTGEFRLSTNNLAPGDYTDPCCRRALRNKADYPFPC